MTPSAQRVRTVLASSLLLILAAAVPGRAELRAFAPEGTPLRYMPTRQYDLQHLRLDLAFDWDARSVAGTATNTLVPLLPGVDSLVLYAAGLEVRKVRVNGAERPFSLDPQAQTLTVRLDRGYGPQDRLEVAVDYSAHPQAGLYFVGPDRGYPNKPRQIWSQGEADLNRFWFPSWDYPNDRTTTEMVATVKRPLRVVSNGKLLEVTDQPDGRRTYHWRMDVPHSTYLVSVAIGDFTRVADTWRDIPVEYYVPSGTDEATARRTPRRPPPPPHLRHHAEDPGILLPGHGPALPLRQIRPVGGGRLHVGRRGEHLRHHPDRERPARRPGRGRPPERGAGRPRDGPPVVRGSHHLRGLVERLAQRGVRRLLHGSLQAPRPRRGRVRVGDGGPPELLSPRGRAELPEADRPPALRRSHRHVRPPHLRKRGAGAARDPPPPRRGGVVEGDPRLRRAFRRADGDHGRPPGRPGEGHRGLPRRRLRSIRLRRRPPRAQGEVGLPAGDPAGAPGDPADPEDRALLLPPGGRVDRRTGDGGPARPGGGPRLPGPLSPERRAPAHDGARSGRMDPEDGRPRQAGRRMGDPAHRLSSPAGEAGGDPRAGRPRRRRGRGGARPGPSRGALLRRPPGGGQGPGQDPERCGPGGPPRRPRGQGQPRAVKGPRIPGIVLRARRADPPPPARPGDRRQLRGPGSGGHRARLFREAPRPGRPHPPRRARSGELPRDGPRQRDQGAGRARSQARLGAGPAAGEIRRSDRQPRRGRRRPVHHRQARPPPP